MAIQIIFLVAFFALMIAVGLYYRKKAASVEGFVLEFRGRTYVVVKLLDSWFAKASVPRAWLEPIR